jgi:hypothetical protein
VTLSEAEAILSSATAIDDDTFYEAAKVILRQGHPDVFAAMARAFIRTLREKRWHEECIADLPSFESLLS